MITHTELLSLVSYDPTSGILRAKCNRRGWVEGEEIGTLRKTGYRQVCLLGRLYLAHRVAWFYVHGRWPVNGLDHKNRIRDDNRIDNLREATQSQNHENRGGVAGYTKSAAKRSTRWVARIIVAGVLHQLGSYATKEEARVAYLSAKKVLHKFNPAGLGELN
jgi:hypothetical protein